MLMKKTPVQLCIPQIMKKYMFILYIMIHAILFIRRQTPFSHCRIPFTDHIHKMKTFMTKIDATKMKFKKHHS